MNILAIDPGTTESAYVVYDTATMVLGDFGKVLNETMDEIVEIKADRSYCEHMAIEMPACYGMVTGQTVMETCRWVGIFQKGFGEEHTSLVYRKKRNNELGIESVTMHLCNSTRAKDPNIRQAIIDKYGGEDIAIGNKKCPKCKGKGWFGSGRSVCMVCNGNQWEYPPGPLCGVTKDVWSAIAVAITFAETGQI